MYESYSEVIGGILEVAGVAGFLDIPEEQARLECDEGDLALFVHAWFKAFQLKPVGAAELLPLGTEVSIGGTTEHNQKVRLGKLLHAHRDRVFGDLAIREAGERTGSRLWRLAPVDSGSSARKQGVQSDLAEGVRGLGECLSPSVEICK